MKKLLLLFVVIALIMVASNPAYALLWGVNPGGTAAELVNIDPWTGTVSQAFALPTIDATDTEIGLAGWSDALYYANSDQDAAKVFVLDPTDGSTSDQFTITGGWEVDGLGYWSGTEGNFLYTSGCSVDDVHRYDAVDGANPQFFWSDIEDPQAMAGDNGGRIFTYGLLGDRWGIYEIDPVVDTGANYFAASPSDSIVGMAYDGQYLYLSDLNNGLYIMNNAGELVNSIQLNYTLYALASTEGTGGVIPEPSTLLLLGSGLIGVLALGRKKLAKK